MSLHAYRLTTGAFCVGVALWLVAVGTGAARAQGNDSLTSDRRLTDLEESQAKVLSELTTISIQLSELRNLLTRTPPVNPRPAALLPASPVSLVGAPTKGNPRAPVAIIEFSDFQCPYCAAFVHGTMPELERTYIVSGQVLFAFRHLPLVDIHPRALMAAESATCAGRQGRFWQMHDRQFAESARLDEESLLAYAAEIDLNVEDFSSCLTAKATEGVIQQEASAAARLLGRAGTPTFLVGRLQPDASVIVTDRIDGTRDFSAFREVIERLRRPVPVPVPVPQGFQQ
jgi:protein-disulfide isomerase